MKIIVILVIIFFVIRWLMGKKASQAAPAYAPGDSSAMPSSLSELRRCLDRTRKDELRYQYRRKICEVAVLLNRAGEIVNDPRSENDVTLILEELYQFIHDCHLFSNMPIEPKFEFACLEAGMDMYERLLPEVTDTIAEFLQYARHYLPDFYAEGKVCPRNPEKARYYYRTAIKDSIELKTNDTSLIEGLMEVPDAGEEGKDEILRYIAIYYGISAVQLLSNDIAVNAFPQTLQQAAELLFRMNWNKIGSADIQEMLDEYNRCALAGNAYAQYTLGRFYLDGRYVEKDEAMGLELLKKAANQSLYLAVDKLGNYYYWLVHSIEENSKRVDAQQLQEWKGECDYWMKQSDTLLTRVGEAYANSFTKYLPHFQDLPTRGPGVFSQK